MKLVRTSGVALAAVCLLLGGCFGKKKINPQDTQGGPVSDSVAPDKVLYQHAVDDINHSHYEVARLTLQSLINTYPDSEYLAKAKMALGDSYYKEGGNTGLSQAVLEYKDFITFFPFLTDECAYAQMQIGMAHYRRVEKPDRDTSEAEASEEEFQVFLQKYPSSPLVSQVEQQLRNVQEILADGDFKIAQFYYTKGSYRASAGRLLEVASRYPLYSNSDKALIMLAGIYERNEKTQYAGLFYSRLVRDYPLSPYVGEAKEHLTKLGLPIPAPDPEAVARMKKEQQTPRPRASLLAKAMGPIESRPNMSAAAQSGTPRNESSRRGRRSRNPRRRQRIQSQRRRRGSQCLERRRNGFHRRGRDKFRFLQQLRHWCAGRHAHDGHAGEHSYQWHCGSNRDTGPESNSRTGGQ